jgi:hypothetical protein
MRYDDIRELLDERPFQPFRIFMSDGKTFDILHPEFAFLMKSRLLVGIPAETPEGVPDHAQHCALLHIVRVQELRKNGKR